MGMHRIRISHIIIIVLQLLRQPFECSIFSAKIRVPNQHNQHPKSETLGPFPNQSAHTQTSTRLAQQQCAATERYSNGCARMCGVDGVRGMAGADCAIYMKGVLCVTTNRADRLGGGFSAAWLPRRTIKTTTTTFKCFETFGRVCALSQTQ